MSSKPIASDFARKKLPWCMAGAFLLIYLVTLNQWVSVRSLSTVSKITGWDWNLPTQWPLFYTLTFPFRFLPISIQPIALNFFSAICAALTIALLVRSVALLPHDRTEEQRIRMRHQDGLLSTQFAWAPAVLAAAVLGLELTMWEHATAATNESLDLLVFAYLIRCLLEFRISQNLKWLSKLALVYGLGVTNNWALISFFPFFLGALIWIRGKAFFNLRFILKMTLLGLAGMLLYIVIPLAWAMKGEGQVTFWDALRSMLFTQKMMAFHPQLRARALILSLTSIVPVIIMGIRFPAGFGDVSSAGASITNFMFRAIHFLFAGVCIWVAFDQAFSPRQLFPGVPFLTFYYLGALAVGYYVAYLMVVFTDPPKKHRYLSSALAKAFNPLVRGLAWLAVAAVPVALMVKNFKPAYSQNGKLLMEFAEAIGNQLPPKQAILLSDDPMQLALMEAWFSRKGNSPYMLVNSRSLPRPAYHRDLVKRYGTRWPTGGANEDVKVQIDPYSIVAALNSLSTSNAIYYLHPSFGYYFEVFYPSPNGLVWELKRFPTNTVYTPRLSPQQVQASAQQWKNVEGLIARAETMAPKKLGDGTFVAMHLSRALNAWGVDLQKADKFGEAAKDFESALNLNTNNVAAMLNLDFNRSKVTGQPGDPSQQKSAQEFSSQFRAWDTFLSTNGPVDVPPYLFSQGQTFLQQYLVRQACDSFKRSAELDPTNSAPKMALISALIHGKWLDEAHAVIADVSKATNDTSRAQKLNLISMEAAVFFARQETNRAEATLRDAMQKYPKELGFYESLNELYRASGQWEKSLELLSKGVSMLPTNIPLRMQRAEMALNAHDTNAAIAELEAIKKIDPANTDAALFRAFVAIQQKDSKKALEVVDELLQRNDRNAQALVYKGIIHMEAKEDDKAIDAFNKALKVEPDNVIAVRNRAIVHLRAAHLKEAKQDYERLLAAFPKSHQVYYGLGEIAAQKKDNEEAVKNFEIYLKYAPTNVTGEAEEERKTVEARLKELRAAK